MTNASQANRAAALLLVASFQVFISGPASAASASSPAASQPSPLLEPAEAVRLALERNFSLSLARDQVEAASIDRRTGIGPFLPEVSASAVHAGEVSGGDGRTSVGASAGLLVFDGFRSWNSYSRLKSLERAGRLQERLALESLVETVLSTYYEIASEEQRLDAIRDLLAVSGDRSRLAQARLEVGAGSRLEQLQAAADLNADSSAWLGQLTAVQDAKIRLNRLLSRAPDESFRVLDSIHLEASPPLADWRGALADRNAAILLAREERSTASSSLKEARAGRWPSVNAGLGWSYAPPALNPAGAPAGGDDLSYSVNLSLPIFDRLRTDRAVGTARVETRSRETRLAAAEADARAGFEQAAARHASGAGRVALEERNLETARLQAEAAQEKFRLGASTPLEFRDAQRRLLDARSRLAAARHETKRAELALKRLAGMLAMDAAAGRATEGKP